MKLVLLAALVLMASAYKPARCLPSEIQSERGCLKDCSSPQFAKCPDFFTLQFEPNFCALSSDGTWSEHTFECQACKIKGMVGVTKGPCFDPNAEGTIQPQPQPIEVPAPTPRPLPLPRPIFDNPIGVIKQFAQGLTCSNPRPTEQTCPTLNYFVAPELNFCGIDAKGRRKGYDLACSACKDKSTIFYFNSPCNKLAQPIATRPAPGPVQPPVTQQPLCLNDRQCKPWEFCLDRKCLDRCALMRCAGGCVRGQCQPVQPVETVQVAAHAHY